MMVTGHEAVNVHRTPSVALILVDPIYTFPELMPMLTWMGKRSEPLCAIADLTCRREVFRHWPNGKSSVELFFQPVGTPFQRRYITDNTM
jgi:hypothetical protein